MKMPRNSRAKIVRKAEIIKLFLPNGVKTRKKFAAEGKYLQKSLQSCKVANNLAKLEGLLKVTKSTSKAKIIQGFLYVLRQLLVKKT